VSSLTTRIYLRPFLYSVVCLLFVSLIWSADSPKVAVEPRARPTAPAESSIRTDIRADTTVVLIPVTVTDPLNRFVTGLEREHFRLTEEKIDQTISYFASEDAPLSVGLVFDTSGSMGSKLTKSRQAVAQFFKTANPQDEFFLVQFNDRPDVVVDFTTNLEEVQNKLIFTQAKGRTALLDAVLLSLNKMKKARNPRKALLVISDGGDNSSRYTESEVRKVVREADVQIYAIGIFEPVYGRHSAEEMSGPGLLNELAPAMRDASICGLGQAAPNAFITAMEHFSDEQAQTGVAGQPDLLIGNASAPTYTPVWLSTRSSGGMPAFSRASHVVSSSNRCCGSIRSASRGEIAKKLASNWSTSGKNAP